LPLVLALDQEEGDLARTTSRQGNQSSRGGRSRGGLQSDGARHQAGHPACYSAFGRADAAAVVLFDDIDPMISVTTQIRSPIDQTVLAFCPKM
jgi:hypothetical protein